MQEQAQIDCKRFKAIHLLKQFGVNILGECLINGSQKAFIVLTNAKNDMFNSSKK